MTELSSIQIQRGADASVAQEYGCGFRRILPWQQEGPSDNGMGLAILPPGSAAEPHEHDEHEQFVVVSGHGEIVVDGVHQPVGRGDAIVVTPGQRHNFANLSDSETLEVVCLWTIGAFGAAAS